MHAFKSFNEFSQGVAELVEIAPSTYNVLTYGQENNSLPSTTEEATANMLESILDQIPSINDEDYPRSRAISVKNTEIGYRTAGNLAFGWRIIVEDDDAGVVRYDFRITLNNKDNIAKRSDIMRKAEDLGWRLEEYDAKKKKKFNNTTASDE